MKDIKKMIKSLVRECVMEVLSERLIETMVRKVVSESVNHSSFSAPKKRRVNKFEEAINMANTALENSRAALMTEQVEPEERRPIRQPTPSREDLRQKIVGNSAMSPYAAVFEDTIQSGGHVQMAEAESADPARQEAISESALVGLLNQNKSSQIR